MRIHKNLDFWATDRGLTRVLTLLVVAIFLINPFLHGSGVSTPVFSVLFAAIMLSGIHATGITGAPRIFAYVTAVTCVSLQLVAFFRQSAPIVAAECAASVVALAILDGVIVFRVFSPGSINANRIKGAIAGYLVLGLIFAYAYEFVDICLPGALALNNQPMAPERSHIVYFSFVSLTTMGYGDIVPVHPIARSLAMAEGLIGQLYPAILIGRLISMGNWATPE